MSELPLLVLDPRSVAELVPNASTGRLSQAQRMAIAYEILFCAFVTCLLDNGWKLVTAPGNLSLVNGELTIEPGLIIGSLRSGKLTVIEWRNFRGEHAIGDWPLAALVAEPVTV